MADYLKTLVFPEFIEKSMNQLETISRCDNGPSNFISFCSHFKSKSKIGLFLLFNKGYTINSLIVKHTNAESKVTR